MSTSVATKLEAARVRLEELGRLTRELVTAHAGVFEEPELHAFFDTFMRAFNEAQARLAEPTLRIATIGTTSSGKSTIVNALVGRRIAPIEAGEMSGGVLTLRSGNERRLTVEAADGAPWEAGTWTGISDADAYNRIRDGIMRPYHTTRKSRACLAPQVISEGPLLPSIDSSLLGLPPDLGIEFIDLPGLKSVQDRANLAVIQTRVHKAFCLVALDYLQTDEEHRKKLLEELTRVVKFLQGRPDSMMFVLNRIDQRGKDDESIEVRIDALRREIKDVLGLQNEPDVLPLESRLLYRAQCAWGASHSTLPDTTPELRLEHLRALFEESASSLKRRGREHPDVRSWLRKIEDCVEDGRVPADDDLRILLECAREWSGGKELWKCLRTRIEESFAELVILPALIEVLETHRSFTDALRAVSKIRKIDSQEQLKRERLRLEQLQILLHGEVSATRERFRSRLTAAAEGLKTGDQAVRHRLTKDLGSGFEGLLSAINEVTGDLTKSLIAPVRDALKANRGVYDLEEEMCRVLDPAPAKDLSRAYDLFSRRIPIMSRSKGMFISRVRENDSAGVERLRETERDARRLYQNMRECLAARGEFTLQGQAESIRGALTGLLEQQAAAIMAVCLAKLPDLSLEQAIASARRARSSSTLLALPSQFFTLPTAIDQRRHEQLEVVDQKQETEHYTTGTCFKDQKTRTVTRDVTGSVAYQDLALPDEDGMARQWSDGVKGGEDSLWETLCNWMVDALLESSVSFSAAIESVLRLADKALEQQQQLATDEYKAVVALWKRIDWEVDRLVGSCERLFRTATSGHELSMQAQEELEQAVWDVGERVQIDGRVRDRTLLRDCVRAWCEVLGWPPEVANFAMNLDSAQAAHLGRVAITYDAEVRQQKKSTSKGARAADRAKSLGSLVSSGLRSDVTDYIHASDGAMSKMEPKDYILIAFTLAATGCLVYRLMRRPQPIEALSVSTKVVPTRWVLVLVINAGRERVVEALRSGGVAALEGDQLYQATQALWLGVETDFRRSNLSKWFSETHTVSEPSEYDVYLIRVELSSDDPGLHRNANQMDRFDAFRRFQAMGLKATVSLRLPSDAYGTTDVYSR